MAQPVWLVKIVLFFSVAPRVCLSGKSWRNCWRDWTNFHPNPTRKLGHRSRFAGGANLIHALICQDLQYSPGAILVPALWGGNGRKHPRPKGVGVIAAPLLAARSLRSGSCIHHEYGWRVLSPPPPPPRGCVSVTVDFPDLYALAQTAPLRCFWVGVRGGRGVL